MSDSQNIFEESDGSQASGSAAIFCETIVTMGHKKKRNRKQIEPWSKENIVALVTAVEQKECVWNHLISEFRDRNKRELAWQTIAKEVRRLVDDCKHKWSCVRANYKVCIMMICCLIQMI